MSTVNEKKLNKTVYAILTILLGTIGINKFYAKNIKYSIFNNYMSNFIFYVSFMSDIFIFLFFNYGIIST